MARLLQQTCFNHAGREAVARCPECRRHYCRECVTEHDDRVICAACLKHLTRGATSQRRVLVQIAQSFQCLTAGLLLWFLFYLVGAGLAALPDSFHGGTLWKQNWFEQ